MMETVNDSRRMLETVSLLTALDHDPRPTFIADFSTLGDTSIPLLRYINPALRKDRELLNKVQDNFSDFINPKTEGSERSKIVTLAGRACEQYTIEGRWKVVSIRDELKTPDLRCQSNKDSRKRARSSNFDDGEIFGSQRVEDEKSHTPQFEKFVSVGTISSQTKRASGLRKLPKEFQSFINLFDWGATALGPIDEWPLRIYELFLLILVDPRPASLIWGKEGILLYNEACLPIFENDYQRKMGMPVMQGFPEVRDITAPLYATISESRRPHFTAGMPASNIIDEGFLREGYYDLTTLPIYDDNMAVIGVYHNSVNKTQRTLETRRTETLASLSAIADRSIAPNNTWDHIKEQLQNKPDLPQAMILSLSVGEDDDDSKLICKLEGSIACKHSIVLEQFLLDDPSNNLATLLRFSLTSSAPLYLSNRKYSARSDLWNKVEKDDKRHNLLKNLRLLCSEFQVSSNNDPCNSTVIMPLKLLNSSKVRGFAVFGLHTRLSYDEEYQSFMILLQQVISVHLTSEILAREGQSTMNIAQKAEISDLSAQLLRQHKETKVIEARFAQFARHAPIGIALYSPAGAMVFANKMFYSLTGFPESEIDKTRDSWWTRVIHPNDLALSWDLFSRLQHSKAPAKAVLRMLVQSKQHPSSPISHILVTGYPELGKDGETESLVVCYVDITEQECAAENEALRTKQAVEAKRQLEDFIDVTSHEIRNPLSVSLQCSEDISSMTKDALARIGQSKTKVYMLISDLEDIQNSADIIQQSTIHQKRIVDDILTISKMEGGMLSFSISPTNPLKFVQHTLKLFERKALQHQILIVFEQDSDYLQTMANTTCLEFDPGRLSQVLINLISNAIKFTKGQGKRNITVRIGASRESLSFSAWAFDFLPVIDSEIPQIGCNWTQEETVYLHLMVEDSGSGISSSDQLVVFNRFSQGNHKDYSQYAGSGLGLYICRALTEIHGGRIGFKSEPGVGSSFGFCTRTKRCSPGDATPTATIIPVRTPTKKPPISRGTSADSVQSSDTVERPMTVEPRDGLNILIVEDNLINQRVLSKQLQKLGHLIMVASHGHECLDIIEKTSRSTLHGCALSIVLMDIEMPVLNGIECTKEIRRREKSGCIQGHLPIIATTGNARSEKVELIKAAGVDEVILEPYSISILLDLVRNLIARYPVVERM